MKDHLEGNESYQKAYGLICSMLNYGAYSQIYFGNNTDSLANVDSLTDEQLAEINTVSAETINRPYDKTTESLPEGIQFMGADLVLESETTLNLYFKNDSESELTFVSGEKELEQRMSGDYIQVIVKGIAAQDLGDDVELKVIADGNDAGYMIKYNPMHYCFNVLSRETTVTRTDELKRMIRALFVYNQKAIAYFRTH